MEPVEYYVSENRKSDEIRYRLTDTTLQVEPSQGPSTHFELADITRVDLVKRRGLGTCRITSSRGTSIVIPSVTVSPEGDRVVQAADYAAWVDALHERLGANVSFRGQDRRMLHTGLFLLVSCVFPPLVLFLHALAWGGNYGAGVATVLFWVFMPLVAGGLMLGIAKILRGLPRGYSPRVIPFELLPATGDHVASSSARMGASAKSVNPHHQVRLGPVGGERFERHSPFGDEDRDEPSSESTPV